MDFTVEVSNEIYPKQVILEAKSAFANYADFVVVPIRVGVVSLGSSRKSVERGLDF